MCDARDPENFVICDADFRVYKVVMRGESPEVFYSQYWPENRYPLRSAVKGKYESYGTLYKYTLGVREYSEFPGIFFHRDRGKAHQVSAPWLAAHRRQLNVLECVVPKGATLWRNYNNEIVSCSTLTPISSDW